MVHATPSMFDMDFWHAYSRRGLGNVSKATPKNHTETPTT